MKEKNSFDVIILGGSYAGLSAAMSLGRSLRNVLIIDSGLPCNRQTPHSHNFITQDGETPALIKEKALAQVLRYTTVKFVSDLAINGQQTENGFSISTKSNGTFWGRKLVIATGIKDIMPDIKGFAACWGISVIHCPYCHGYEFRGQHTAIIANGERAFHLASLVHNLTPRITILTSGKPDFHPEQLEKLKRHGIALEESRIAEIEHVNGSLKQVVFEGGTSIPFDAAYAAVPFRQHSDIPQSLGCKFSEQGYIHVDFFQKTTIAGVYACGDATSMMRSIASAVSGGSLTGAMINKELTDELF